MIIFENGTARITYHIGDEIFEPGNMPPLSEAETDEREMNRSIDSQEVRTQQALAYAAWSSFADAIGKLTVLDELVWTQRTDGAEISISIQLGQYCMGVADGGEPPLVKHWDCDWGLNRTAWEQLHRLNELSYRRQEAEKLTEDEMPF